MATAIEIETPRLRLRPCRESDLEPLARLNANPQVMRHLGDGQTLTHGQTWRQIAVFLGHDVMRGHSMWAIEDRESGAFLGRSGPWFPEGWPMLEVGWVVDPGRWGEGIATEAGRAALDWCFAHMNVDRICSLIAPDNAASARVAMKLGAQLERREEVTGIPADIWIHRRPADIPRPGPACPIEPPPPEPFEILTERFRLRPFCQGDLDDLARLYADADVMRYIGNGNTRTRAQTWREIAAFLGHRQIRGYTNLAIEDRRTGAFVGECGPWFPEGWPMLEVGWLVDPRRWGQGIAPEVGRAALDWSFENLGVDEICSIIVPENVASARVADKLGAKIEGTFEHEGRAADLWIHRRPESAQA
ncbi:MAG: N-acetyltransferase [Planctomycetota bacterium]|nr:MAG: N-acetyltransferase [Planctomycetota bacterium]